jgi:DNA helicase HerA-like ATPase
VEQVILEMGVGEALVSFLDEKGTPGMVERALVCPPRSQIGPITPEQRQQIIRNSLVAGVYEKTVDRESAYELLKARTTASQPAANQQPGGKPATWVGDLLSMGSGSSGGRRGDSLVETMAKSAARTLGSTVGRQIVRGVLGSLLGGSNRR